MGANFRTSLFPIARKEAEGLSILSRCVGLNRGNELERWGFGDAKLASFTLSNFSLSLTSDLCLQAKMQIIQPAMLILSDIFISSICVADYWPYNIQYNEKLMWGIRKGPIIRQFFKGWKMHPWPVPENLAKALKIHWNNYFVIILPTHNLNTKGKHCIPLKSNKFWICKTRNNSL